MGSVRVSLKSSFRGKLFEEKLDQRVSMAVLSLRYIKGYWDGCLKLACG